MISDEGLPCVNIIEKVYIGLLVTVFALGIFSLFRLSYYKAELRKVFDPRQEFIHLTIINDVKITYCESLIKDLNGMELNRWKKLKRKNLKAFMEKIANANLTLKARSTVDADGMSK